MITYICPNCDNEVDLGDECEQCKMEAKDRLRKITGIVQRILTINEQKRCKGVCLPMHDGRFWMECKGCAYFDLTTEINELKKEVEKEEANYANNIQANVSTQSNSNGTGRCRDEVQDACQCSGIEETARAM